MEKDGDPEGGFSVPGNSEPRRPLRSEIEAVLRRVRPVLEAEPVLVEVSGKIAFVGDTHGDVETTTAILQRFRDADRLVFLGDYIDREPEPGGSLRNILTLFLAKLQYPEKIVLLRGNHEANSIIPCFPCEFERDLTEAYGLGLSDAFVDVFNALPLMALGHGIFAAHGGFPVDATLQALRTIKKTDREAMESLLWSDPEVSQTFRGVGRLFTGDDLLRFLKRIGASVFLRGHDYQRLGESIYGDRCLTLFSARQYQTMGNQGVLVAWTSRDIRRASEMQVEDFSTGEWRPYTVEIVDR